MLPVTYDPSLVVASVLVAIMASFTALRLTNGISALDPRRRKPVIAQSAIALGGGIWSMHFVGMLAVELPFGITYNALPTLLSALLAILVTGLGLILLHFGARTQARIVASGTLTGLGIVGMHYLGMSAVSGNCIVRYDPAGVAIATSIAIVASVLALEFAYRRRTLPTTAIGAAVLGLAISSMHYSAMLHTSFYPGDIAALIGEPTLSSGVLALIVSLAAFVICGVFLLTAIPHVATREAAAVAPDASPRPGTSTMLAPATAGLAQPRARTSRSDRMSAYSRAFADDPTDPSAPTNGGADRIPYERENAIRFLLADQILVVRADGHYTNVFNRDGEHFCPWSISRIEKSVASPPFIRTHRSYLVNLDHVAGFKREGDKAFCLLNDGAETAVPVSRGRIANVQKALGL